MQIASLCASVQKVGLATIVEPKYAQFMKILKASMETLLFTRVVEGEGVFQENASALEEVLWVNRVQKNALINILDTNTTESSRPPRHDE